MVAIFYRITKEGVVIDNRGDYVFINRGRVDEVVVDWRRLKIRVNVMYRAYYVDRGWIALGPAFDTDDWGVHVNLYSHIPLVFVAGGYPTMNVPKDTIRILLERYRRAGPYIVDDAGRSMRVGGLDGRAVARAVGEYLEVYNPRWFVVV